LYYHSPLLVRWTNTVSPSFLSFSNRTRRNNCMPSNMQNWLKCSLFSTVMALRMTVMGTSALQFTWYLYCGHNLYTVLVFSLSIVMILPFYSAPHCKHRTNYGNSVRPSVCPSDTRRYCVKTTARSTAQFALSDSKMCLLL